MYAYLRGHSIIYFYKSKYKKGGAALKKAVYIALVCLIFCKLCACGIRETANNESSTESREEKSMVSNESVETSKEVENKRIIVNFEKMKGIWVSQYDMADVYCKDGVQRSKADYVSLVKTIISNIKTLGFNTVIYQIRPFGDSMYQSEYYTPSKFVTGKYGRDFRYDAVEIFVGEAKSRGLSVHAWINPMRLMTAEEISLAGDGNILKRWYNEGKLPEVNGRLYLDVSRKEARDLIVNGAVEAITKYDFDGLHMDDYFYPTSDPAFDRTAFSQSGYNDLNKYRIDSLNALVSSLYKAVKEVDERLIFGISPAGNLKTVVKTYYADVYEWCAEEGYLDYILPQVYFGLKHGSCPFVQTVKDWAGIITNGRTKLYVGMTLGKAVSGSQGNIDVYAVTEEGKNEWINNKNVIKQCVEFLESYTKAEGYCFFCYQYFYNPVTGRANEFTKDEVEAFLPVMNDSGA